MRAFDSGHSCYPAIFLQSAEVAVAESDSKSEAYEFRTKSAQSGGLETNGRRERILGLSQRPAVQRFVREARGYWASMRAPEPPENVALGRAGGGRGTVNQHSLAGFRAASQRFAERACCPDSRLPCRRGLARTTALRAVAPGSSRLCSRRCCARPCGALAVHVGFRAEQSGE